MSRTRDFTIPAWPIVSHVHNAQHWKTQIFWPFFTYKWDSNDGSEWSIFPWLFYLRSNASRGEFTLMLFFYMFYLNLTPNGKTFFCLPLITYVSIDPDCSLYFTPLVIARFENISSAIIVLPLLTVYWRDKSMDNQHSFILIPLLSYISVSDSDKLFLIAPLLSYVYVSEVRQQYFILPLLFLVNANTEGTNHYLVIPIASLFSKSHDGNEFSAYVFFSLIVYSRTRNYTYIHVLPIFFHYQSSDIVYDVVLLLFHRKTDLLTDGVTFSIHPFLFVLYLDKKSWSLALLFYTTYYYKHEDNNEQLFWCLFLATWVSKSNDKLLVIVLAALFLHKSSNQYQYYHLLPLFIIYWDNVYQFENYLIFFNHCRKQDNQEPEANLYAVLPLVWYYNKDKYTFVQIWPIIGWQKEEGNYMEISCIYPFFAVRYGTSPDKRFTNIYLPFPLVNIYITDKDITIILLLISYSYIQWHTSVKTYGYFFLFYWMYEHQEETIILGLFPFIHYQQCFKADHGKLFFHILLGIIFHRTSCTSYSTTHTIIPLLLFYLYWDEAYLERAERNRSVYCTMLLVMWITVKQEFTPTHNLCKYMILVLPVIYLRNEVVIILPFVVLIDKRKNNYSPWFTLVIPIGLFFFYRDDNNTYCTQFPLALYTREGENSKIFIWVYLYIHNSHANGKFSTWHFLLGPLLVYNRNMTKETTNIWIFFPLSHIRWSVLKVRDYTQSDCFTIALYPLFYVWREVSRETKTQEDLLIVLIPLLTVYRSRLEDFLLTILFPFSLYYSFVKTANDVAEHTSRCWVFPLFYFDIEPKDKQIMVIPLTMYLRKRDQYYMLTFLFALIGYQLHMDVRKIWLIPFVYYSVNIRNSTDESTVLYLFPVILYVYPHKFDLLKFFAGTFTVSETVDIENHFLLLSFSIRCKSQLQPPDSPSQVNYDWILRLTLYGLFGSYSRLDSGFNMNWFFLCYLSYKDNTQYSWWAFSPFLLPPYIVFSKDQFFLAFPFYFHLYDTEGKNLQIFSLPCCYCNSAQREFYLTCFMFLEYYRNVKDGTYAFKMLYLFELFAILRISQRRTQNFNSTHICTTEAYLFPLIYYERSWLMTGSEMRHLAEDHYSNPDLEKEQYFKSKPCILFTVLWLWRGMGVLHLRWDKQTEQTLCYFIPFFRFETEKAYLLEHQSVDRDYFTWSIIWIIHPSLAIIHYQREYTDSTYRVMLYFAFIFFFMNNKDLLPNNEMHYKGEIKLNVFWFFHSFLSLIAYRNRFTSQGDDTRKFYIFILLWIHVKTQATVHSVVKVFLLWFFFERLSFIGTIYDATHVFVYVFPLFSISLCKQYTSFKSLFLPSHDEVGLALINYLVYYDDNKLQQFRHIHIMPLFWSDEENISPALRKYLRVYLFWIFYKYLALCYYWDEKQEEDTYGWFVFLLAGYWYTDSKLIVKRSFVMFWALNKDISLIMWGGLWKAPVDNIDSPDPDLQQRHLLIYVIPLFYVFRKYGDTPCSIYAIFYLFYKRLSLIYMHLKHNDNWGYILPLIYIVLNPQLTIVKAIFIPTTDSHGVALIDYKKRQTIDTESLWKLHVYPLFYTHEHKTVDQIVKQKETFVFWFLIVRDLSLIQYWFLHDSHREYSGSLWFLLYGKWDEKSTTNMDKEHTFALFWFLSRYIAVYHWSTDENSVNQSTLNYLFLLYHYKHLREVLPSGASIKNTTSISVGWLLHPRIALAMHSYSLTLSGNQEVIDSQKWGYLFPLFYGVYGHDYSVVKVGFLPTPDNFYLSLFHRRVDFETKNHEKRIPQKEATHLAPFFYIDVSYDGDICTDHVVNIFWFFFKRISLVQYWNHLRSQHEESTTGFYSFFLFTWWKVMSQNYLTNTYAFGWLIRPNFALIHYTLTKQTEHDTSRYTSNSLSSISIEPTNNRTTYYDASRAQYSYTKHYMNIFLLLIVESTNIPTLRIIILWLFHSKISLFRYEDTMALDKRLKCMLLPVLKYRGMADSVQYVILPLIPITTYSYKLGFVSYKYDCMAQGKATSVFRILYRLVYYSSDNIKTVCEVNPVFRYENNQSLGYSLWDLFGGIIGNDSERGPRICCLYCC